MSNNWEVCGVTTGSVEEIRSAVEFQRCIGKSSDCTSRQEASKISSKGKSTRKKARLLHSTPALLFDFLANPRYEAQRDRTGRMGSNFRRPRITPSYTSPDVKRFTDLEADSSCSSSLAGDASELEQSGWSRQIRSFLDAASRAEAMIRSQRGSDSLKQWLDSLNPHLTQRDESSEITRNEAGRERLQSGTSTKSSILSNRSMDPDLTNISPSKVLETQEPLMNYWDNYQVPLYSSSSETEAREPPTTYAEEFPWDDVGNPLTDQSQDELLDDRLNMPDDIPTSYMPFCSPMASDTQAKKHGTNESIIGRQDTMDLSTTTSVLFNQKTSSMEASFEVCSPSIMTIDSQAQADQYYPSNSLRRSPSPLSIYGLRTHPDGGSQHRIDREPASQTPVGNATSQTRTPVRFLSLEPEYQDIKDTRQFHTLPRTGPQARIRHNTMSEKEGGYSSAPIRCSSAFSLEELKHLRNKWLCSDIILWSKQQLSDVKSSLRRLLTRPVLSGHTLKHDASSARRGSQTWLQWQNEISELIRSAEWNLKVLIDHTSFENNEQGSASSPNPDLLFPKLFDPEATSVQEQWKEIIENARYWLLHSCSNEALRQQLRELNAKILDITSSIRQLSNRQTHTDTGDLETKYHKQWTVDNTSEHASVQNMIQRCLCELKRLSGQLQRLYGRLERRFPRQQQMSLVDDAIRTFTVTNSELRGQLECLNMQLLTTQERLARVTDGSISEPLLTRELCNRSNQYQSNASGGVHRKQVCTCCVHPEHSAYLFPTSTNSSAQNSWYSKCVAKYGHRHRTIVLVTGGLLILSCFCCYIVTKIIPCTSSTESLRAVFVLLGEWFPFLFDTSSFPCPLKRERLSGILDYTYGSSPI